MANLISLTVMKCTATPKQDGFIVKLQNKVEKTVATPFGAKTASTQVTYYAKFDNASPVGMVGSIDLDDFRLETRDFEIPDGDNAGQVVEMKWLHIK